MQPRNRKEAKEGLRIGGWSGNESTKTVEKGKEKGRDRAVWEPDLAKVAFSQP